MLTTTRPSFVKRLSTFKPQDQTYYGGLRRNARPALPTGLGVIQGGVHYKENEWSRRRRRRIMTTGDG
eukprot:6460396-Pyramimonas_sp.AAC.1